LLLETVFAIPFCSGTDGDQHEQGNTTMSHDAAV
jgi:hypothetical protein